MHIGYININIHLQKTGYFAYTYYFNRLICAKSPSFMDCLFQIKSKMICLYHKDKILTLFTYLYYDKQTDEWQPIYTDVFNNLINLL